MKRPAGWRRRPRRQSPRRWVAGALALAVVGASLGAATAASAAPVYEIDGRWAPGTPTDVVASGDVVNAEWRVNVNDSAEAPSNEPVDDVTFTTTVENGRIASIPDLCLTTGVDTASSISADGKTLTCNLGTQNQGTAVMVMVPVIVDGPSGSEISMTGDIEGQTDEIEPIEIQNPFRMDMHWVTSLPAQWDDPANPTYATVRYPWSLRLGVGSEAGPDEVTFRVTTTPTAGTITPQGCSAFDSGSAGGHPWSGTQTGSQWTNFVDDCVITPVAGQPGVFDVTLRGIDYELATPPTHDSSTANGGQGNPLPTDWDYVASGLLTFRVQTNAAGSTTLEMSPVTWVSPTGAQFADIEDNNSTNSPYTRPGGWSASWNRGHTDSGGYGDRWNDAYRVAPGTQLQMDTYMQPGYLQATNTPGMCTTLDSQYVTYDSSRPTEVWVQGAAGGFRTLPAPAPGVIEYYVGTDPLVDPNSPQYNPDLFTCAGTTGWTTNPPADNDAAVKAVRWTFPATLFADQEAVGFQLATFVTVNEDVPPGTDVWMFGSRQVNGVWTAANTGNVTPTPGARYPTTQGRRDIVRIIVAEPRVEKSADRGVVRPGVSATYTLNYSANGAGQIPESVDDFRIVDTLPVGMNYVAGSADPEPVVSTNGSGQQVLTWELDGVTTNAQHALTYQAVADDRVQAGEILTNTATASLGNATSQPATAQVTVSTSGTTEIGKSADTPFIPNVNGDGVGEGSWTVTLRSFDPTSQAFTDTIDILPFNGDGRGTTFAGDYSLTGVDAVAGATVYYTTEDPATLSDDPDDPTNGARNAPSGIWSTTFTPDATAIRVIGPELAPGAVQQFTVNIETDGVEGGDVLVNRAQARAEHTELVMRTSAPVTVANYYSASLKKFVQDADGEWRDADDVTDYPKFRPGETVKYRIVVENTGQGTLRDILLRDDQQPELGEHLIDELAPGEEAFHEYEIVLDESTPQTVVNTACADAPAPEDSQIVPTINCDPAGFELDGDPEHEKVLVSAEPIGNGQWQVVYGITVGNTLPYATSYDLEDTLHFTDQAKIASTEVTQAPVGVQLADPAWDGQGNVLIAAQVPLLANNDPAYIEHYYEVTVVADVPLQLDGAGSGEGDPTRCGPDGDDADRAFNNTSAMTDARGDREDDQACAELPSIDIDKKLAGDPVKDGQDYTTTYDIVVANDGGATGEYVLHDQLRFGKGVTIEKVTASNTDPGDIEVLDTYTGQGADLTDEVNALTGEVELGSEVAHTYRVVVNSTVTDGPAAIEGGKCADGGTGPGGFRNVAVVTHNGLTAEATACAPFAWLAKGDLPKTGSPVGPIVGLGAALLVAAGLTALVLARRREENEV
ncbi:hypothetical protein D9V41_00545 [Aeromicrobium phragmitis]|uniref:Gram-positive cocci surface proteins LPxTG domain-containing protein n=1 Tax=Aeromicrobium phragmitis TaxID=2478914 RepID=A0A3L8PT69_9ACTN|nr:LPXTG cell wall anchor domain-containing protein [Aeromicrobium phragmitis]RLV57182.1 hypothetical protein D9V41_00545 [Aeromicrobium phragmitis]